MKYTSLFAIGLLTSGLSLHSEIVQQDALVGIPDSECLVAAAAAASDGGIRIEIKTAAKPTSWTHIFINIDGDSTTGFNHHLGGASGKGLDMMLEGDIAYLFSGKEAIDWAWATQPSMSLSKTIEGDIMIIQLVAPGLEIADQTSLLAVTYSSDYQDAKDHLPRSGKLWKFTKENLTGSTEMPKMPEMASVEKKNLLNKQSLRNLRQSFREVKSYACYYGRGQVEALSQRDAAIIETKNQTPESIAAMQAAGTLVIGYISIGEDIELRKGDQLGYGGFDSAYFDRDGDDMPDKNPIWNSYYADASQPSWRRYFLDQAYEMRQKYGVDGFFLDTVDTSELYKQSEPAMVSLIRELRAQNPRSIIINNRGFHTVEELGNVIDGVMYESFTASYDWERKAYYLMGTPAWDWGLSIYNTTLKPAMDAYDLVVLVLDYTSSGDAPEMEVAYDRAVSFGYVPEVSNIYLDQIYTVNYEPTPDPKYLEVLTTQESITHKLEEPINGFPAGTAVVPSSVYPGYSVAALVDGIEDKDALDWRSRAWASWEKRDTHALEFKLPAATSASSLRITWAWDNGYTHASRKFHVELQPKDGAAKWLTMAKFADNEEGVTNIDLSGNEFIALRVFQEVGGGSSERPHLMWIEQVELVQ